MDYQTIIDKYYPEGSRIRDIYMRHCRSVASLAVEIAARKGIDTGLAESAAMLHDIGIFLTNAPSIECHGSMPYITHGILGGELLRSECPDGADAAEKEWYECMARVAERHTGAGITADDIAAQGLPLPSDGCYMPETPLERLVCYADKFYSKSGSMERKPLEKVVASMERISPATLSRFLDLHAEFGD